MKNNSINIWLMGGLGNQLFQLNKAVELNNRGYSVTLVNNLVLQNSIIASKILKWKIHDNVLNKVYDVGSVTTKKDVMPILLSKSKMFGYYTKYYKSEYDVLPTKNMFGYFQKKINMNLHSEKFLLNKKSSDIVMHIRLTDNNNLVFSKKYYLDIIHKFNLNHIKVVTDDNAGAKKFLDDNTTIHYDIVSSNTLSDFATLRGAKYVIAAPSTFSFWAAISNETADKVYVPETFLEYVRIPPKNWIVCG